MPMGNPGEEGYLKVRRQEMENSGPQCRTCRFFDRHGKCRRYPPKVFMVQSAQNMKFLRHLPDVTPDEYCGEFEPKLDRVPAATSADHI